MASVSPEAAVLVIVAGIGVLASVRGEFSRRRAKLHAAAAEAQRPLRLALSGRGELDGLGGDTFALAAVYLLRRGAAPEPAWEGTETNYLLVADTSSGRLVRRYGDVAQACEKAMQLTGSSSEQIDWILQGSG